MKINFNLFHCHTGYDAVAQLLIDNGANINSTNANGDSALMLAAAVG